ncbi:MAG TPA: isochorismatase family protein [Gemmatimonadales bacterium]|jgi:nicotinamidase-related amidase
MTISAIDSTSALVVIDLQKGVVGLQTVHPAADVVARSAELARAFRARERPVVLVNVDGMAPGRTSAPRRAYSFPPDWTDLVPELDAQPGDFLVTKQRVGAFLGTDLDQYLRRRGVTQVVVTGVATGSGVEATARSAYDLGYNVVFVTDAMTDLDAEVHRHCIDKTFPRLGELATTAEVVELLRR